MGAVNSSSIRISRLLKRHVSIESSLGERNALSVEFSALQGEKMIFLKNCLKSASALVFAVFLSVNPTIAKDPDHNLAEGDNPKLDEVALQEKDKQAGDSAQKGWVAYSKLVEGLVREFFPKAKIKQTQNHLHVEFKSRPFDIPSLNKIEPGVDWGGILFDMDLKDGQYSGVHAVPKKFNEYSYYHVMLYAPYSARLNKHLETRIAYPFDVPPDFLKRFTALVENFEQHF